MKSTQVDDKATVYPCNLSPSGSKFIVSFDYENNTAASHWVSWKMKHKNCRFSPIMLQALFGKLNNYNGGEGGRRIKSIRGFTEIYLKDSDNEICTIRACPSYRSCNDWHDWVDIEWLENDSLTVLAGQILIMLDTTTITYECTDLVECAIGHKKISHDHIALVHSASFHRGSMTMPIESAIIGREKGYVSSLARWFSMEKEYQIVDVSTFQSKCFVLVDTVLEGATENFPGTAKRIIKLMPKNDWKNKFIDYSNTNIASISSPDQSVTDEDLKFYEA